jgi:hypothetical protein
MLGHETEEMFLHYPHIERDEKHSAVERALALVDGHQVECGVEGAEVVSDLPKPSRRQNTRND